MPSKRTLLKGLRDFGVALAGFAIAWLADNAVGLGLDPMMVAIISTPLSLLVYRYGREATGRGPAE